MLINNTDPTRYYIGSSVNLARRLGEYYDLTLGERSPKSNSEKEISETPASHWSVLILDIALPAEVRVLEQLAICTYWPSINRSFTVEPLTDPSWGSLDSAIKMTAEFMLLFPVGSAAYLQFSLMLNRFSLANTDKIQMNPAEQAMVGQPVWAYASPHAEPIIYSSINYVLSVFNISYGTLMRLIEFSYFYGEQAIFALKPLTKEELKGYKSRPSYSNKYQLTVDVYDKLGKLVHTAKSSCDGTSQ